MSHFDKYAVGQLFSRDVNSASRGSLELWFPYIRLDTGRTLYESLNRLKSGNFDTKDQESFYVFFHEYIHFIQAACFPACQMPVELTYCYIFDVNQTAICKRTNGVKEIHPIQHSPVFNETIERLAKTFLHTTIIENPNGEPIELSIVHILEGCARILEEKFRGVKLPSDDLYDSMSQANEIVLGDDKLSERQLLEFAEQALSAEYPDEMLVRLLLAQRDGDFIPDEELNVWDRQAAVKQLVKDGNGVLTSTYFATLRDHLERFYTLTPTIFPSGRVFVSIYDAISEGESKCLPVPIVKCISEVGMAIIAHESGAMEAFNPNRHGDAVGALALKSFESVCKCLMSESWATCGMLPFCRSVPEDARDCGIKVDDCCVSQPWAKKNNGELCDFTACWRAFGLEGSVKGVAIGGLIEKELVETFLLHYTPGTVFGCEVRVWSNDDGNTPHFHVRTVKRGRHERQKTIIDCCVRIDVAEYFPHGNHKKPMNNAQCKELDEFLRKKSERKGETGTNWEVLVKEWRNHYRSKVEIKTCKQPDYTVLNYGH